MLHISIQCLVLAFVCFLTNPCLAATAGTTGAKDATPVTAGGEGESPATAMEVVLAEAAASYGKGDYAKARDLWQTAAAQGNHQAQYQLGRLYEQGEGVAKSDRDAAAWYSMAATGQVPDAQARLGCMYRDGRGVAQNATRATLLLYGAAMEGHTQAMRDLADLAPATNARSAARLFGLDIAKTQRTAMRRALKNAKVTAVREEDTFICDVYNVEKAIPGANTLAACYGPAANKTIADQPLGFVKIDYPAPDAAQASRITAMVQGRFGQPTATEGTAPGMQAALWNMGDIILATQYAPQAHQMALMYMVPRVYHLTQPSLPMPADPKKTKGKK